ncbi:hypothetical protein EDB80DRAFT_701581 [Ilyonectria destructans]|nr:hypothetical protein EDB80DRAFT_701581 [Ilyonectria destructans]
MIDLRTPSYIQRTVLCAPSNLILLLLIHHTYSRLAPINICDAACSTFHCTLEPCINSQQNLRIFRRTSLIWSELCACMNR